MSRKSRVAIGYDEHCLMHDPGEGHPEHPMRLGALKPVVDAAIADGNSLLLPERLALASDIIRVHDEMYLNRVCATAGAHVRLDPDTVASPLSSDVAFRATGQVLAAVDAIFNGRADNAFLAVRPPGHHAEPTHAMGFCFFNNVAVAAEYARHVYGVERIAVVDFDVHHGNGTQSAFWNDRTTLFVSSHQAPHYPGTGAIAEVGGPDALGYNLNVPLAAGHGDSEYVAIYGALVSRVLAQFGPELIIVSAGLDLMAGDPLGGMGLTPSGVRKLADTLVAAAGRSCEGRIIFALEGGYDLTNLRNGTQACLDALGAASAAEQSLLDWQPHLFGDGVDVLEVWRSHWTL